MGIENTAYTKQQMTKLYKKMGDILYVALHKDKIHFIGRQATYTEKIIGIADEPVKKTKVYDLSGSNIKGGFTFKVSDSEEEEYAKKLCLILSNGIELPPCKTNDTPFGKMQALYNLPEFLRLTIEPEEIKTCIKRSGIIANKNSVVDIDFDGETIVYTERSQPSVAGADGYEEFHYMFDTFGFLAPNDREQKLNKIPPFLLKMKFPLMQAVLQEAMNGKPIVIIDKKDDDSGVYVSCGGFFSLGTLWQDKEQEDAKVISSCL